MDNAKRVINGTFTEVWLGSSLVAEAYGLQAKAAFNKEEIARCGHMATDQKVISISCTGSLKMYKVNSRMALAIGDYIRNGKDIRFTIVAKLADPDSYGSERVALKNVSFDDLTLFDAEAKTVGKVEAPFTFTDYTFMDRIRPR